MTAIDAIWLDMQLPPALCAEIEERTKRPCRHFSSIGLDRATDLQAFEAARAARAIVLSKDSDWAQLVRDRGAPPSVVWLRCGNCSTASLRDLLERLLGPALDLVLAGEPLVEIVHPG